MRSYSLFTILLLCMVILLVDILAFYWLQSITQLLTTQFIERIINVFFWTFTSGLILSIVILKLTLNKINPRRKNYIITSLYGLAILSIIPKFIFVVIISILYFSNYIFSQSESIIIVPLVGLLSGFLPFLSSCMRFLLLCIGFMLSTLK